MEVEEQRILINEILSENRIDLHYSSDSDLSDWGETDEDDFDEDDEVDITLKEIEQIKIKELLIKQKEEIEKNKKSFWCSERINAEEFFESEIRKSKCIELENQPVISSFQALNQQFGSFCEWKKLTRNQNTTTTQIQKKHSTTYLLLEEDVIREILWQFTLPNPQRSLIFNKDWTIRSNIHLPTLSNSSLRSILSQKYTTALEKLERLNKFKNRVLIENCKEIKPPKSYKAYAHAIDKILNYFTKSIIFKIENQRLKNGVWIQNKNDKLCNTLIQLNKELEQYFESIRILYELHKQAISEDWEDIQHWFLNIKLLSSIETSLQLQKYSKSFSLILYIYSWTLISFLTDIFSTLDTVRWNNNESLFIRNPDIKLRDANFWESSITIQPYIETLREIQIEPFSYLNELVPNVVNLLKTMEILKQLSQDFRKILGILPNPTEIVIEFLENILQKNVQNNSESERQPNSNLLTNSMVSELELHFKFLGLEGALVSDSFSFIKENVFEDKITEDSENQNQPINIHSYEEFTKLNQVPLKNTSEILSKVLEKWFKPYFKLSLKLLMKLLQDYKVDESMDIFREIILGAREDFAQAILTLAKPRENTKVKDNNLEIIMRNIQFQELIDKFYPEGRENFEIEFKVEDNEELLSYHFNVIPYFPLNLILTQKAIQAYLFISKQLQRIRKSLWNLNALNIKECKTIDGVALNRVLIFRFSLIHFCSSFRTYLMNKIFNQQEFKVTSTTKEDSELDEIIAAHQSYLDNIEIRLLKCRIIDKIIIKKMLGMSEALVKHWKKSVSMKLIHFLEDCLLKCWRVVNDFSREKYNTEFEELSFYFGPVPNHLKFIPD